MAITPQEMKKISDKLEVAKADTTPHIGVQDDELLVIGDANKTEKKVFNYTVRMRFPSSMEESVGTENVVHRSQSGKFIYVDVEYKDVTINPRNDLKIVRDVAVLYPFFRKQAEDGGLQAMTEDEFVEFAEQLSDEVIDAMYNLVADFLDEDKEVAQKFTWPSVLDLILQFMEDFPEVFNEADFFTGGQSERQA